MQSRSFAISGVLALIACAPSAFVAGPGVTGPRPRVRVNTRVEVSPVLHVSPVDMTGTGSAIVAALVGTREILYVADTDDGVIRVIDAGTFAELSSLGVGGAPSQLVMTTEGRMFVSIRDRHAILAVTGTGTETDPLCITGRAETPAEPLGLALTPDENSVLVASGWGHALSVYGAHGLDAISTTELAREPRAVVVSDDGKRAFVSHAVGGDLDVVDLAASAVRHVSLRSKESLASGRFGLGDFALESGQGFALAKSTAPAGRVFAPHAAIRPVLVSTEDQQASGYGSVEVGPTEDFDVAVLDDDTGVLVRHTMGNEGGTTCVLPRAAAVTMAGELLVACVGSSEILAFDAAAVNPHEAKVRSWKVPEGPLGIAVDEASARAFVWSQFAHAVTSIALAGKPALTLASATLPRTTLMSPERVRGRILFHSADARISADGRACASCHPDGRDDGLVWATPDGPRNPPMLAGRLEGTGPYGWLGSSMDVPGHLKKTFARLGAKGLPDPDRDALVAYLRAMPAPDRGPAPDEALARVGARIFDSEQAGCASCHGEDGTTPDTLTHNVGSWANSDVRGDFDTPSLRFVGGTGPYFHDGRYRTLDALLRHTNGKMGQTAQLSAEARSALVAYLGTL